jgi:cytochrome oxidase assembly protein ShyY1
VSSTREHPAVTDNGKPRRRLAFIASPGWIGVILAVLAFSAACFFILAPWQFGRNAERTAQNTAVDASITAPAVPVGELMSTTAQPPGDVAWRVVTATGEFDPSRQVQVRLRQDANGNPVSEVIAPFRVTTGQTLLVDRGYVSFTDVRNEVPIAALPTGQVTISGRVQVEQTDPSNRQPLVVGDHIEAYAINAAAIGGAAIGGAAIDGADPAEVFLQGYVQLTDGSPGVLTPIELPQTDSGPFLSYALQWEAFGVIALIGLGVFVYREIADPRPPDDRDQLDDPDAGGPADAAVTAPAGSQRRRRSRDGFDRSQLYDD